MLAFIRTIAPASLVGRHGHVCALLLRGTGTSLQTTVAARFDPQYNVHWEEKPAGKPPAQGSGSMPNGCS